MTINGGCNFNSCWISFGVFMVLRTNIMVFWVMTSSRLVLKIEAYSARTMVTTYLFTLCHNQEDQSITQAKFEVIMVLTVKIISSGLWHCVVWWNFTVFPLSGLPSKTLVNFHQTTQPHTPKDTLFCKGTDDISTQICSMLQEKRLLSVWCFHFCDRWLATMVCNSVSLDFMWQQLY
jgi:hypothetical protein